MFSIDTTGQIVYTVNAENDIARERFEVAAWWGKIKLAHGTYAVELQDHRYQPVKSLDDAYWVSVNIPGVVTERYTPSLFGGVPTGGNSAIQTPNELTTHNITMYAFMLSSKLAKS
ncbi:hypothetical protein [Microbacterium sp.]|uniref:hypothetical protein n=1 Tax=Microbacterium sp. TaxID=51671 RepID=UPI0026241A5A|nr:hypothetical protein [Microbacterium sp.]